MYSIFKVNDKNTRTTSLFLLLILNNFKSLSSISTVYFEQLNVSKAVSK